VPVVQDFLNQRLEKGDSVRKVRVMRTVLSAALTRAVREELLVRNVARLAELPESRPARIHPWSASEARQSLAAAKDDSLYGAFVVLIFYGLRRGEALGLRWEDIDLMPERSGFASRCSASVASCSSRPSRHVPASAGFRCSTSLARR
jgi:integrase